MTILPGKSDVADDSWIWAEVGGSDNRENELSRTDHGPEEMALDDIVSLPISLQETSVTSYPTTLANSPSTSPSLDMQQLQQEVRLLRDQNKTLLRNICRLYLTAKKDIGEKSAEIKRLSECLSLVPPLVSKPTSTSNSSLTVPKQKLSSRFSPYKASS